MKLMGHTGGRRNGGGSPMGRVYRETTPAMLARVTAALDERIARALGVAGNPLRDAERSAGSSSWIAPSAAAGVERVLLAVEGERALGGPVGVPTIEQK
jgi:hypothetical protein